jgi:hypothetical protein
MAGRRQVAWRRHKARRALSPSRRDGRRQDSRRQRNRNQNSEGKSRESELHALQSILPPRRGKRDQRAIGGCECGGNRHGWPARLRAAALTEAWLLLGLALAGLEAALRLVDHIDAALAAYDAIVAMPGAQRFQRIADFHGTVS